MLFNADFLKFITFYNKEILVIVNDEKIQHRLFHHPRSGDNFSQLLVTNTNGMFRDC